MYAGVDIGGTKTLIGALDDHGVIQQQIRFPTPHSYDEFITQLTSNISQLAVQDFRAGAVAMPGRVDRLHGRGTHFGNLPWQNVPLQADAERIFTCPMLIENDAKLGALSESMLLPADKRVLYVTISTGIGTGLVDHRQIVPAVADSEGGHMLLEYKGERMKWESFASGHAIAERYGKPASDITDPAIWQRIAYDLGQGFIELMAVLQPDIIVVGGSIGEYFDRYKHFLLAEIGRFPDPMVPVPELRQAARPDLAVLYGCYDLARSHYGPHP